MDNMAKTISTISLCLVLAISFSSCRTIKSDNSSEQLSTTYDYYEYEESISNTLNYLFEETTSTQISYNEYTKNLTTAKSATTTKKSTTTARQTTTTTKPTTTTTRQTTTTTKPTTTTTKPTTTQSYSDVLIISDTRAISDKTINTDIYITSTGVASFSNVTINGNIYCYGKLTLNNCVGKGLYGYQYGSMASCSAYDGSHGYITGNGNYDLLYIKNDALDYAFNKWGKQ